MCASEWIVRGSLSVSDAVGLCLVALRGVAFWTAVMLPIVYLPLLVASSFTTLNPLYAFSLVGIHVVALLVGHRHTSGHTLGQ
jgi:hypothetical protein